MVVNVTSAHFRCVLVLGVMCDLVSADKSKAEAESKDQSADTQVDVTITLVRCGSSFPVESFCFR